MNGAASAALGVKWGGISGVGGFAVHASSQRWKGHTICKH